jgi:hypothetical protein
MSGYYEYRHQSTTGEFSQALAFFFAIIFGLSGLAISIWLGAAMLTPDVPFDTKHIAGGVVMIIFCWITAIFSALIGGMVGWLVGVPLDCCDDCVC